MSDLIQHILALTIVAACLGYIGWHGVQALRGRRSRVGSCCDRGCDGRRQERTASGTKASQIVYIPVDMLGRGRKR